MKISFIDHNSILSDLRAKKFRKVGFEVETFDSIDEGIAQRIADSKTDLISLNSVMPNFSGPQVMDLLRKNEHTKHIPVIMLDNLGSKKTVDNAIGSGAVDYILEAKFSPDELVSIFTSYTENPQLYKPQFKKYQYDSANHIVWHDETTGVRKTLCEPGDFQKIVGSLSRIENTRFAVVENYMKQIGTVIYVILAISILILLKLFGYLH